MRFHPTFRAVSLLTSLGCVAAIAYPALSRAQTPAPVVAPVSASLQTATEPEFTGEISAAPWLIQVKPTDARLHYEGRFDLSTPALARCSWPASAVTLRFRGAAVAARLGLGENRFTVVVDGVPIQRLTGKTGDSKTDPETRFYRLASGLKAGAHTVTLFKNTETNVGDATFSGFELPTGSVVLKAPVQKRKIEVIGDSISAGFGVEGADQNARFVPVTENAYRTYGAIAARAVKADYACFAWSGRTMWPTFTVPEIYDRILPNAPTPLWTGEVKAPDVYLINLATNEFGRPQNPDEDGWVKAYRDFIGRLRQKAPRATIYCALSSMLGDGWPVGRKVRTVARGYLQRVVRESNAAGDAKVRYLEFEEQNIAVNGAGAAYHPGVKTNQIMAAKFEAALRADLGW